MWISILYKGLKILSDYWATLSDCWTIFQNLYITRRYANITIEWLSLIAPEWLRGTCWIWNHFEAIRSFDGFNLDEKYAANPFLTFSRAQHRSKVSFEADFWPMLDPRLSRIPKWLIRTPSTQITWESNTKNLYCIRTRVFFMEQKNSHEADFYGQTTNRRRHESA